MGTLMTIILAICKLCGVIGPGWGLVAAPAAAEWIFILAAAVVCRGIGKKDKNESEER